MARAAAMRTRPRPPRAPRRDLLPSLPYSGERGGRYEEGFHETHPPPHLRPRRRPGHVSIHAPDPGYAASGYEIIPPSLCKGPAEAGAAAPEFRVARMRKTRAGEQNQLRVFWAWNEGAAWRVPSNPRWTFASARV